MAFGDKGTAQRKPTIACVGYVDVVGEMTKKDEKIYFNIPLTIKALGNGMDIKTRLTFHPSFFHPDFDKSKDINAANFGEAARGAAFVYEKNLFGRPGGSPGLLETLCGDQENLNKLKDLVVAMPDQEPVTIYDTVTGFLREIQGTVFGYILRQPDKVVPGEFDENGKPVKAPSQFYEIDNTFWVTPANVGKVVKRAEKNRETLAAKPDAERFLLKFNAEEYM